VNEPQKPALLFVLAGLILLEGAALAVATVYLVVETVLSSVTSVASAIAFVVVAAIAAAGVILIGISTLRAKAWIRGAAICWQVLQILLAFSILQAKSPGVAWLLAVPAVLIIVLIFTPPVARVLARDSRS
jgi:hypothetical protein